MKRNRKAFTLVELLVVVGIIALLLSILLPSLGKAKEITNRTKCAANLRGIAQGMQVYAAGFGDSFPVAGTKTALTTTGSAHGFNTALRTVTTNTTGDVATVMASTAGGNVTASLWILIRQGSASPDLFICPSDSRGSADSLQSIQASPITLAVENTWDFGDKDNLSYSPMNLFNSRNGNNWGSSAGSTWALMADQNDAGRGETALGDTHTHSRESNPTTEEVQAEENSSNHSNGEGQNIVYGDGHTKFFTDPFQGPADDNVYARRSGTTDNVPVNILDNGAFQRGDGSGTGFIHLANDVVLLPLEQIATVEGLAERVP
jgi:prepilin-type N-terminal cleavage/methylation domain-containing protein